MTSRKLRSRGYPVIALHEAVELLRLVPGDSPVKGQDRSSLAKTLGYTSQKSGIAARKIAALGHFGLLSLRGGLYALSDLGRRVLDERDPLRRRAATREACLTPTLFRELIHGYEQVGRVPYQLATALSLDHGIQENAKDEVAHIFMASAKYAGILDGDGLFREEYFEEVRRPRPVLPFTAADTFPPEPAKLEESAADDQKPGQKLRFFLTEQKPAELRLPARLNEQDILLLKAQIEFLELQVRLSRPDQRVRLDVVRGIRNRE